MRDAREISEAYCLIYFTSGYFLNRGCWRDKSWTAWGKAHVGRPFQRPRESSSGSGADIPQRGVEKKAPTSMLLAKVPRQSWECVLTFPGDTVAADEKQPKSLLSKDKLLPCAVSAPSFPSCFLFHWEITQTSKLHPSTSLSPSAASYLICC